MIDEILVDEEACLVDESDVKHAEASIETEEAMMQNLAENMPEAEIEDIEEREFESDSDFAPMASDIVILGNKNSKFDSIVHNKKTKVYVKTNAQGFITAIESELFLEDKTGWIEYDEGEGDRFIHAQGEYFEQPLVDILGNYRYKI